MYHNVTCGNITIKLSVLVMSPFSGISEESPLLGSSASRDEVFYRKTVVKDFLTAASPVDFSEWPRMTWYNQIYEIFKVRPTKDHSNYALHHS